MTELNDRWGKNMLNEDKIKLMTGIAMFEKERENGFFRLIVISGVIISVDMFRSFFSYTICYLLCALIWVLYHMEQLLNTLDIGELIEAGKYAAFLYGAGLFLYLIITWLVYRRRYEYSKRGMKVYMAKLKRLEKRYEFQNRARELSKEGGRHDRTSRN